MDIRKKNSNNWRRPASNQAGPCVSVVPAGGRKKGKLNGLEKQEEKEKHYETISIAKKSKRIVERTYLAIPAGEKGNSVMAFQTKSQKDYLALKEGIVRNLLNLKNAKARRKEFGEKLDKEITVPDEELKRYVDDIIRKDLRTSSYDTLIDAKETKSNHRFITVSLMRINCTKKAKNPMAIFAAWLSTRSRNC